MTDPLHQRLLQLGEDQRRHRKLTADLLRIEAELQRHDQRQEALGAELHKEGRDLRKLEGLSLTALFHTLLCDRSEQLQQERQEFLALKLRYDAELQATAPLHDDAERCRRELAALGDLPQRRAALLREREAQLALSGRAAAQELADLGDRLAGARADLRETDAAIDAGRQALATLSDASAQLGSARGWGKLDIAGGGLIASSIKHSHIDGARSAAERAQRQLQRFCRELQDVGRGVGGLEIQIGGFDKFADFFFDGLIFDWIVQSKIVRAQEQVRDTAASAQAIVQQLERRRRELAQLLQQLEAERERMLIGPD